MIRLTKAEEQVMKFLWKLERAYLKNIIDEYYDPKPATTTVVTLLKRMIEKGVVGYNQHGSNREYYPLIQKADYFSSNFNVMIKDFFNNSTSQFASYFTNETNLSLAELEELKKIVEKKIQDHKKRKP